MKCYYDTAVFAYFFFKKDTTHTYSPIVKQHTKSYISLFSEQEFMHLVFTGRVDNFGVPKQFFQIWNDLSMFTGYFETTNLDLGTIKTHVYDLIGAAIRDRAANEGFPDNKFTVMKAMDWMHLGIADLMSCEVLLTTDHEFEYLTTVKGKIPFTSLRKVIIFNKDTMQMEKELEIY